MRREEPTPLNDWQRRFIEFALNQGALSMGDFLLKSGRRSPYFFNAGRFNTGAALDQLGQYYAQALVASGLSCDLLFGPAYKGIPLASSTAIALNRDHHLSLGYAFNRKEAKDHGEGGQLVGAPLEGRVVIIDDVITAGTAIAEVQKLLQAYPKAQLVGVLVAFDRQEKAAGSEQSAMALLESQYGIPIIPVVRFNQLIDYFEGKAEWVEALVKIKNYRKRYGIT